MKVCLSGENGSALIHNHLRGHDYQVVAFLNMKMDGWAALSIDLREEETYLIHPGQSFMNPEDVYRIHLPLMQNLTLAAQAHMAKLGNGKPPSHDWNYRIALQPVHMNRYLTLPSSLGKTLLKIHPLLVFSLCLVVKKRPKSFSILQPE
jgi:hypothetical protein